MSTKPRTRQSVFKAVDTIEVRIWNERVGAVTLEPTLGFYVFQYDPKFVRTGVQLAPLTMPLAQAQNPFVFTDLPVETYKRLPALLADALPDKFGNALITRWMTLRGVNANQITELDRLAYMGKRGFGALEFKPMRGSSREPSTALQLGKLVESARVAVTGSLENDLETQSVLTDIIRVGTSAGGARAKAAIAWNVKTQEIRAGQFEAPAGFEHWLLKFDGLSENQGFGQSRDYGRIEYAYSLMAKAAGIEMSECQLLEENGRAHFMTKRFDRAQQQNTTCKPYVPSATLISTKLAFMITPNIFKPFKTLVWVITHSSKVLGAWCLTSWQAIAMITPRISRSCSSSTKLGNSHPHMT